MKLNPREAAGYFAKPDAGKTGVLIYGADSMRVALKRQQVLSALLGPAAEEEMRLTRMSGADLRKDPALLLDALKATGFFPGPRAAFVEEATDTAAPSVIEALKEWQPGDAQLIVTAGALKATSKLRKAFEAHGNAYAVGIYDDPPTREEIVRTLSDAGLTAPPTDIMASLTELARDLDPGDFRQTIEKIGLYKRGDTTALSQDDIDACAPTSIEAALDDVLHGVAEARASDVGAVIRKLQAQGVTPVSLCIGAMRHFRILYSAASDPGGPAAGMGRMRPPVFGPRRDKMIRQAQNWGAPRLETALTVLTDTDLQLRSAGQHAPAMALVERAFIRLAMLGAK
ncbi:MAG: DNA polymerase III subunit delta [Sulfitobacter sp.]